VQFPHAGDDGLLGFLIEGHVEGRVLLLLGWFGGGVLVVCLFVFLGVLSGWFGVLFGRVLVWGDGFVGGGFGSVVRGVLKTKAHQEREREITSVSTNENVSIKTAQHDTRRVSICMHAVCYLFCFVLFFYLTEPLEGLGEVGKHGGLLGLDGQGDDGGGHEHGGHGVLHAVLGGVVGLLLGFECMWLLVWWGLRSGWEGTWTSWRTARCVVLNWCEGGGGGWIVCGLFGGFWWVGGMDVVGLGGNVGVMAYCTHRCWLIGGFSFGVWTGGEIYATCFSLHM
jgi:hypothetical protein